MDKTKGNFTKYCIQIAAYSVASMFCSGAIVQTFLLLIGLTESEVYLYSSLTQVAQVVVMVLMIFISGKIKQARLLSAIANLLLVIPIAIFIIGAIFPSFVSQTYVMLIFLGCVVAYGGNGLYAVLSYTLPYKLIDIADYGKLTGISGAVAGISTFALSTLHTTLVASFDFVMVTVWFFSFAIISAVLSFYLFFSMKERQSSGEMVVGWSEVTEVFRNKDTYLLFVPNLSRGLAFGVFNVIAVMAISSGISDSTGASAINIILQASSFAASLVFSFFYKKLTVERMLIIATIGVCIAFPFVLSFNFVAFLAILLVALFFRFIVDSAIPTALVKIIPESQIGAYSAIRMLIFTAGQAVAAALVLPLSNQVGYVGVLIIASVMQLICGVGHYAVIMSHKSK